MNGLHSDGYGETTLILRNKGPINFAPGTAGAVPRVELQIRMMATVEPDGVASRVVAVKSGVAPTYWADGDDGKCNDESSSLDKLHRDFNHVRVRSFISAGAPNVLLPLTSASNVNDFSPFGLLALQPDA